MFSVNFNEAKKQFQFTHWKSYLTLIIFHLFKLFIYCYQIDWEYLKMGKNYQTFHFKINFELAIMKNNANINIGLIPSKYYLF